MISAATAYCNNEVGYVAWTLGAKIPGCLGFEVTRVYLNPDGSVVLLPDGSESRVKTVALVAFNGQSNPDWNPQDTGVWPVQKLTWRDLTLRKRRTSTRRRPSEVNVRYEIRPVGDLSPGWSRCPRTASRWSRTRRPACCARPIRARHGHSAIWAPRSRPIAIFVTTVRAPFRSTFTNGILAAQWLTRVLMEDGTITPGELEGKLRNPADAHRKYLAGDVLPLLHELFARPGTFHLALYELEDTELQQLLVANASRIHVILSNTGKNAAGEWDDRNRAPAGGAAPSPAPTSSRACSTTRSTSATTSSWSTSHRTARRRRSSPAAPTGPGPASPGRPTTRC